MVFVESETTLGTTETVETDNTTKSIRRKHIGLSERELDKFETILTRQHRNEIKSIRNNFRNSSLDDSHLFNNSNNPKHSNLLHANSISANLNVGFENMKLNEFVGIKNDLKISSSSSDANSAVIDLSSPSPSTQSLAKTQSTGSTSSINKLNTKQAQLLFSNADLDTLPLHTQNHRSKLLSSLSSDLDEDEIEEDDHCHLSDGDDELELPSSYASRRETIIFNQKPQKDCTIKIKPNENTESESEKGSSPITSPAIKIKIDAIKKSNFNREEVMSISSMTSNYSQFDFLKPPAITPSTSTKMVSNNPIASFFFSNSLFKRKPQTPPPTILESPKSVDGNASNFFRLLTSSKPNSNQSMKSSPSIPPMPYSLHSSTSSLSNNNNNCNETHSIKSNLSSQNLSSFLSNSSSVSNDLKTMPNSVLIFENRPSNLPAKSQQEALKHKHEYDKMVEAAKRKELKENQLKIKKNEQQVKKEDFMANSLRIWNHEILPNWKREKKAKRTHQLWWHGLPPSIRGKVWKLAIGNDLHLTKDIYQIYKKTASDKLELLSQIKSKSNSSKFNQESSVELIKLDVSRTFPQLCFFQRDGPYHEALHSVLGAYACFNPKIGYVQGMSFLTAILLLNMEAHDAFICLANLLDMKYLLACFCMDQIKMNRYFRVHEILLEHNLPKLHKHFLEQKVKPDLYLIEWVFTLFSKSLPLDVMSRVWDVFFRDKEEFLFRTALGILSMYRETLLEMDFIHIVQFLTKLPENINATHLFKAIEQIRTNIDENYFTFEQLMEQVVSAP